MPYTTAQRVVRAAQLLELDTDRVLAPIQAIEAAADGDDELAAAIAAQKLADLDAALEAVDPVRFTGTRFQGEGVDDDPARTRAVNRCAVEATLGVKAIRLGFWAAGEA